jgi:hypothetical protein
MIQGYSLRSATLYHLKSRDWLLACSFLNVCPPCQRNKTPAGKTHVTISRKKLTPAYSWPLLSVKRFKTLYGKEASQTPTHIWVEVYLYSSSGPLVTCYRVPFTLHIRFCQVEVWRVFRDFNYQTLPCISKRKQIFTFHFNIKWPKTGRIVYILIFLIT